MVALGSLLISWDPLCFVAPPAMPVGMRAPYGRYFFATTTSNKWDRNNDRELAAGLALKKMMTGKAWVLFVFGLLCLGAAIAFLVYYQTLQAAVTDHGYDPDAWHSSPWGIELGRCGSRETGCGPYHVGVAWGTSLAGTVVAFVVFVVLFVACVKEASRERWSGDRVVSLAR